MSRSGFSGNAQIEIRANATDYAMYIVRPTCKSRRVAEEGRATPYAKLLVGRWDSAGVSSRPIQPPSSERPIRAGPM